MTRPPDRTVTVLGLGRLGSAIAANLSARGWAVSAWNRSPRVIEGLHQDADPAAAAARSAFVVLALFDGTACRSVLDRISPVLREGQVVVNVSTISPKEAEELAERALATGAGYLHAPVIGSRPAAELGALRLLAGGNGAVSEAAPLLEDLGSVIDLGTPGSAAAAKLVANGVLACAVLAVRDGLAAAESVGLGTALAADLLESTALGPVVKAKRSRLEGGAPLDADFTVGALVKDVALLAELAEPGRRVFEALTAVVDADGIDADSDVAAVFRHRAEPGSARVLDDLAGRYRLSLNGTASVPAEVLEPLVEYVAGHATGDPAHFRRAFLPTAHVEGLRDGGFVSWALEEYCSVFTGRPAPDEDQRRREVEAVSVRGSVATATVRLWHGDDVFVDVFLLVRVANGWRIANKAYHREEPSFGSRGAPPWGRSSSTSS